jgi:hypothetical protein
MRLTASSDELSADIGGWKLTIGKESVVVLQTSKL